MQGHDTDILTIYRKEVLMACSISKVFSPGDVSFIHPSIDLLIVEILSKSEEISCKLSFGVNEISMSSISELVASSTIFLNIGS